MELDYCGVVDSEDGTLLLGDARTLLSWRGREEEPEHSATIHRALNAELPGLALSMGRQAIVYWDMGGPGTVDVYADGECGLVLVRVWLSEECYMDESDWQKSSIDAISVLPFTSDEAFAEFTVESGYLALFWSLESGCCIDLAADGTCRMNTDDLMTISSGMIVALQNGVYRCLHDEASTEDADARRCRVVKVD